ncbi:related to BFR1 - Nuclear segregation protein [Melanopsichium pennsylvanicum]|uniref:Related to BFR1 - Nuclear segregation protein n=2 Tax=Melanopsichium pennsylvanicum TaxID=63383 RepID=A0AAJ5C393_9BASI|nr:related to BFR1-Nuclear segregation protein [Melanopsichium pennsylvanicum 4]SNX82214.1 related to BFR1 - Nuclear segregation protein [Melanopsichium pennsylvanicum]
MADTTTQAPAANPATNGSADKKHDRPPANPDAVAIAKLAGGKPDAAANTAELDKLSKAIDSIQKELNQVRSLLSGSGPSKDSPAGIRRSQLRAELDTLRNQQAGSKGARGKTLEDLRTLQDSIGKKIKDLQHAKSKTPYKSTADVDSRISRLEQQVESGSMKLVEEKKALSEISQLKKNRKVVENFDKLQSDIDSDRAKVDALKSTLDSPEAKALNKRYDEIKAELDSIQAEQDKQAGSRGKLLDQRTQLSAELDALYQTRRDRQAAFRAANDTFYAKLNQDREKRIAKQREERQAQEAEKRKEHEQELREEAALPAFAKEIEDCDVLINYFSKGTSIEAEKKVEGSNAKAIGGKALNLRQVNSDAMVPKGAVLKTKNEQDETYFAGKASRKPKGRGNKRGTPLDLSADAADENTAVTAAAEGKLNVPLGTLSALLALSIPPPTNAADVSRVVENLKLKKQYFVSNQARVTRENVERVEKMLAESSISDVTEEKSEEVQA